MWGSSTQTHIPARARNTARTAQTRIYNVHTRSVHTNLCFGGNEGTVKYDGSRLTATGVGRSDEEGFAVGLGWTFHSAGGFSLLDRNACPGE